MHSTIAQAPERTLSPRTEEILDQLWIDMVWRVRAGGVPISLSEYVARDELLDSIEEDVRNALTPALYLATLDAESEVMP